MILDIKLNGTVLETERLLLRPWRLDDLADFYEYASVPGVGECAGWPHHTSSAVSETILKKFIAGDKTFAITLKETGKVIGSLGLEICASEEKWGLEAFASRKIGYVLSKDYWGHGYMTEAARAVISWLFANGAEVVYCGHFVENDRSRRVIEKCGFVPLGHVPYEAKLLDRTFDAVMYCLRRAEWNG